MKRCSTIALLAVLTLTLSTGALHAAEAAPATDFTPVYIPKTKIYAQALVDEVAAKNPGMGVAIHAMPPGLGDKSCIIATNIPGRVGSPDTQSDINAMLKGDTILNPKLPESTKLLMLIPLKDSSNNIVGTLGLVFPYSPNGNQIPIFTKGTMIRNEMQKKVPNLAELFKTAD